VGLKDLFSKEGRRERSLQKACAKAADKKIKSEDRRPALWTLLEEARAPGALQRQIEEAERDLASKGDGKDLRSRLDELRAELEQATRRSEEAILGLLKRFTFLYDTNMVNDEEEKEMIFDGLVALGPRILPQLRQHLRQSSTLSWGLRLLNDVCDQETTWSVVSEVMKDYEPGYERDPSRKQQMMSFLGEFKGREGQSDSRAVDMLLPFLGDHDETVRYLTVESLFKQGDERAREPLLQLLTNTEEESGRIKHRIADGFAEVGWLIKGFRGTVEKILPEEFVVDGKGRIKLKKSREKEEDQT
jgi:hypothetical protein